MTGRHYEQHLAPSFCNYPDYRGCFGMGRRADQRVAHEALERAVVDLIALLDQAARSPDSYLPRIKAKAEALPPVDVLTAGYP